MDFILIGVVLKLLANRASGTYFSKSDSVTAIGAIVVGLLGNLYSRIFKGYAYPAMVPGVLFLIPVRLYSLFLLALPSSDHVTLAFLLK